MNAILNHIQINVSDKDRAFPFYKEMLTLLGFEPFMDEPWGFGMTQSDGNLVIWVCPVEEKHKGLKYHRKAPGVNHLAFKVETKEQVDEFNEAFVRKFKPTVLYDTPKAFPEYTPDYYAVFFEDPDRIKIEVVSM